MVQLFRYLEENKAVCVCALRSVGHDHLRRFFETDIYAVIHRTVEQIGTELGLTGDSPRADIDLVTHFYVMALAGMMESWLLGELDRTPEELIAFADQLLQDPVLGARLRLEREQ